MLVSNRKLRKALEEEIHLTIRDLEGELLRREAEERALEENKENRTPTHSGHLRQEMTRCGKDCTCNDDKGHGPYWYHYFRKHGKLQHVYMGKTLVLNDDGEPIRPKDQEAYFAEKTRQAEAREAEEANANAEKVSG